MSFISVNEAPNVEILIAKNLEGYRRGLKDELDGKRAEIMRYIWGEKGMPSASRAEVLAAKGAELHDLDCRLAAVDRMIAGTK